MKLHIFFMFNYVETIFDKCIWKSSGVLKIDYMDLESNIVFMILCWFMRLNFDLWFIPLLFWKKISLLYYIFFHSQFALNSLEMYDWTLILTFIINTMYVSWNQNRSTLIFKKKSKKNNWTSLLTTFIKLFTAWEPIISF